MEAGRPYTSPRSVSYKRLYAILVVVALVVVEVSQGGLTERAIELGGLHPELHVGG